MYKGWTFLTIKVVTFLVISSCRLGEHGDELKFVGSTHGCKIINIIHKFFCIYHMI